MTRLHPLEKQFINVMQGIWNINPNQDQFTSSAKTIHRLSEEGKQSLPEFLVGANYSNSNVDARNLSFKSDKNKSN